MVLAELNMRFRISASIILITATSCSDRPYEKRHYQEVAIRQPLGTQSEAPSSNNTTETVNLAWTVPSNWFVKPATPPRIATFLFGPNQGGECSITSFPGDVGGLAANATRWAGQLNLAPVADEMATFVDKTETFVTDVGWTGKILNFDVLLPSDEPQTPSMRVAILTVQDSTIFVKLTGSQALLQGVHEQFIDFCQSFRLTEEP